MNGAIRIHDKAQIPGIFDDLRAMYRLSQVELAATAGVFQSQISDWLAGKRSMDVTSVIRLAKPFDYDLALIPTPDPAVRRETGTGWPSALTPDRRTA